MPPNTENQLFVMSQRCTDTSWLPPTHTHTLVRGHTPSQVQTMFALFYPLASKQKPKLWFSFNSEGCSPETSGGVQKEVKKRQCENGPDMGPLMSYKGRVIYLGVRRSAAFATESRWALQGAQPCPAIRQPGRQPIMITGGHAGNKYLLG